VNYDAAGQVTSQSAVNTKLAAGASNWTSEPGTLTTTAYAWYDGAVQASVTHDADTGSSTNPLHTTTMQLDALGQLTGADVNDGVARDVSYVLDEGGQVLRRDESRTGSPAQHEAFHDTCLHARWNIVYAVFAGGDFRALAMRRRGSGRR